MLSSSCGVITSPFGLRCWTSAIARLRQSQTIALTLKAYKYAQKLTKFKNYLSNRHAVELFQI